MSRRSIHGAALAAIGLLGASAYANALHGPFVFDDHKNIVENPHVRLESLSAAGLWRAAFESPSRNRPLANLSFALNHYAGGDEVFGYHAVNVAIHLANAGLVYLLALLTFRRLSRPGAGSGPRAGEGAAVGKALFAAAVFAVHPLQTQAVTYVVQRMTSLAAFFFLLTLLLWLYGLESASRRRRWGLWAGALASGVAALGSKEIAATLPLMIALYHACFFDGAGGRRRLLRRAGLPLAALALLALAYLGGDPWARLVDDYAHRDFSMGERLLTQSRVVAFYASLVAFPHPSRLNLLHHVSTSRGLLAPPSTLFASVAIAALAVAAWRLRRRHRLVCFCVLWILGNLAIESSIVPLEMIYEHRVYLPMVGFALLASELVFGVAGVRVWTVALASLAVSLLWLGSHQRNEVWRDAETLWSDVVAKNPRSHRALNNLGVLARGEGQLDEAEAYYRRSLTVEPDFEKAHFNFGNLLKQQGRLDEAVAHYREALRVRPDYAKAHVNLGNALRQQGQARAAAEHYRRALRIAPDDAQANRALADLALERGDRAGARAAYARAVRSDPDDAEARYRLGALAAQLGDPAAAIEQLRAALERRPELRAAANDLAWVLATCGDPDLRDPEEALRWARRAAAAGDPDPSALDTLAAAYASAGRFEQAVETVRDAIARCCPAGEGALAGELAERLRLYQSGRPYRDPAL